MTASRGIGRGGARPGAGRPKGVRNRVQMGETVARITERLTQLGAKIDALHMDVRASGRSAMKDYEALPLMLKRLTDIERHLGLRPQRIDPGRHTRHQPMGPRTRAEERAEELFKKG